MKRLVYSPSVKAWVKTDTGIIDLSPYIVNCQINRKIDDISYAELEFRNPRINDNGKLRFMFTEQEVNGKVLPVFHPMDPITITMERIAGRPIQIFTGYCDTTPDVQLFPGTAKIKASCTLKRLKHTYWDPALPFVDEFLKTHGWEHNIDAGTGQIANAIGADSKKISNTVNLNDVSIGSLLYSVLQEIGGWDPSNIYIQPLPGNIVDVVKNLFNEITKENTKLNNEIITNFLSRLVGQGSFGTAASGGATTQSTNQAATLSGPVANERQIVNTIRNIANNYGLPPEFPLAVAIVETGLGSAVDNRQHFGAGQNDWYQWTVNGVPADPYAGQPSVDWTKGYDLGYSCSKFCEAAKLRSGVWQGTNWRARGYPAWARVTQLSPGNSHDADYGGQNSDPSSNHLYSDSVFPSYIAEAKRLLTQYPN